MCGSGLLDWLINNLPFEIHLPGYNYCGPGTKLNKRLRRGDRGINLLDEYCKQHDIAYSISSSLSDRHKADIILMEMAKRRAKATDASFGEKIAANLVSKTMLAKIKSGAGLNKNQMSSLKKSRSGTGLKKHFKQIINHTTNRLRKLNPKAKQMAIELAIAAAKEWVKDSPIKTPRIIPVPKTGGVLPLIPIFAGLSATGKLAGGANAIVKVIKAFKSAKKRLAELKKNNTKNIALSIGEGLHLKRLKTGFGIHVFDKKN